MNLAVLEGYVATDLDVRSLSSGGTLVRWLLSVPRYGRGREGRDLVRVLVFGRTAENCARYLGRRSRVSVRGRIRSEFWPPRGQEVEGKASRLVTEVIAEQVHFLDPPKSRSAGPPADRTEGEGRSG